MDRQEDGPTMDAEDEIGLLGQHLRTCSDPVRAVFHRLDAATCALGHDIERRVQRQGVVYATSKGTFCHTRFNYQHLLLYIAVERDKVPGWNDATMRVSTNKRLPGTQVTVASFNDVERAVEILTTAHAQM